MSLAAFLLAKYAQDATRVPPNNPLIPPFLRLALASAVCTIVLFYFTLVALVMRGKERVV